MSNISCEQEAGCARIRLACGDVNALTTQVLLELTAAVEEAGRSARGAMLCGGDKFFCNGVDLDWALGQPRPAIREMFLELGRLILALLESQVPVVGVIKGHATGAGMALFLACDYRYAAAGRVLIGKPEIRLGVPTPTTATSSFASSRVTSSPPISSTPEGSFAPRTAARSGSCTKRGRRRKSRRSRGRS